MNQEKQDAPIWNCRAKLKMKSKIKVKTIQAQQEATGNKMSQNETLDFIINAYKK